MKIIFLIGFSLVLTSCSSDKASQTKINALEVTEKLVKNKSTQVQVLKDFGTPDVVEKTSEGDMWAYGRSANESSYADAGISHYITTAALWNYTGMNVGGSKSKSETKTASLVLFFNKNKILRTYTYRTERY